MTLTHNPHVPVFLAQQYIKNASSYILMLTKFNKNF